MQKKSASGIPEGDLFIVRTIWDDIVYVFRTEILLSQYPSTVSTTKIIVSVLRTKSQ